MIDNERNKRATSNGRFGVMAAVAPRKRQCENERLCPAGSFVEAATSPSRWDVVCKLATASFLSFKPKNR